MSCSLISRVDLAARVWRQGLNFFAAGVDPARLGSSSP
jgi:hypothetical protein